MKYLIESEIDNGSIYCSSDYIEAENEKEALMSWVYANYKELRTEDMGKIILKPFKLGITKANILKAKQFKKMSRR